MAVAQRKGEHAGEPDFGIADAHGVPDLGSLAIRPDSAAVVENSPTAHAIFGGAMGHAIAAEGGHFKAVVAAQGLRITQHEAFVEGCLSIGTQY